jgi:hypothetical protein
MRSKAPLGVAPDLSKILDRIPDARMPDACQRTSPRSRANSIRIVPAAGVEIGLRASVVESGRFKDARSHCGLSPTPTKLTPG